MSRRDQASRALSIYLSIYLSFGDAEISSILHDKYHKFLGGFYTFEFTTASVADVIGDKISDQLRNIDSLLVRSEYKVRIYAEYLLGACRFMFAIHDLNRSQLHVLESLTHSYLKRWLGLPRGASWALAHDVHGLNIKSVTHLYEESRVLNLSTIRFFSDCRVRHALDVKERREETWRRKFSPATYAKRVIEEVVTPLPGSVTLLTAGNLDDSLSSWSSLEIDEPVRPVGPVGPSVRGSKPLLRGKIQAGIQERVNDFWREKIGRYVMQGDYIALVSEEGSCITWKSYLWDIPQGVLKFAMNAGLNTLPSFDNLKRWGKLVNDRCPFCGNVQTLLHILSNCGTSLDQGRYTWRHNSVLKSIIEIVRPALDPNFRLYSDIPGFEAPHGGTIPPHILVTNLRPDLFIINEAQKKAIVFELTCPWDSNIARSHTYKEEKYAPLVADLSQRFHVYHFSVEISVRGQVSKENRCRLKSFNFRCCARPGKLATKVVKSGSKAALLSSYSIFSARKEPTWISPPPLVIT